MPDPNVTSLGDYIHVESLSNTAGSPPVEEKQPCADQQKVQQWFFKQTRVHEPNARLL